MDAPGRTALMEILPTSRGQVRTVRDGKGRRVSRGGASLRVPRAEAVRAIRG